MSSSRAHAFWRHAATGTRPQTTPHSHTSSLSRLSVSALGSVVPQPRQRHHDAAASRPAAVAAEGSAKNASSSLGGPGVGLRSRGRRDAGADADLVSGTGVGVGDRVSADRLADGCGAAYIPPGR